MDPIATQPTFTITQTYSCGCRDSWLVFRLPEEVHTHTGAPCLPAVCTTCQTRGEQCEARKAMETYTAVDFASVEPVQRVRYRRLNAS